MVVTRFDGVLYFKVTLNSPKKLMSSLLFSVSMEYTESNFRNFIQLSQFYVTGHR